MDVARATSPLGIYWSIIGGIWYFQISPKFIFVEISPRLIFGWLLSMINESILPLVIALPILAVVVALPCIYCVIIRRKGVYYNPCSSSKCKLLYYLSQYSMFRPRWIPLYPLTQVQLTGQIFDVDGISSLPTYRQSNTVASDAIVLGLAARDSATGVAVNPPPYHQ